MSYTAIILRRGWSYTERLYYARSKPDIGGRNEDHDALIVGYTVDNEPFEHFMKRMKKITLDHFLK